MGAIRALFRAVNFAALLPASFRSDRVEIINFETFAAVAGS